MTRAAEPAVVLFVYNRPDLTQQVFDAIRAARPRRLFVFADGPKADRPNDRARTLEARAVTERVDWPCEVHRDYAASNRHIRRQVESGLDRVFDDCESAIVFEDDCVPHPTFFPFCAELLARYRDDGRVMGIGGSRLTPILPGNRASYAFSTYGCFWGWATWGRAWRCYDRAMESWPQRRDASWLLERLGDRHAASYWTYLFDAAHTKGDAGDWDRVWQYSALLHEALFVTPSVNLVSNVGFDPRATHTRDDRSHFASLPVEEMRFPLRHPPAVLPSAEEDRLAAGRVFSGNLERLMIDLRARIRGVSGPDAASAYERRIRAAHD